VTEEDIYAFARQAVGSVWALELLLLLQRSKGRAWRSDELLRELRSSQTIVEEGLTRLRQAGLVAETDGAYTYWPASPQIEQLADGLQRIYASKPISVVKAIMAAPSDKLRIFSDAFRLKD
jgi:DNA-binding HxlR family transcriptional regulator